jgi:hypothetical protein
MEDLRAIGEIILMQILNKSRLRLDTVAQDRDQWRALVNKESNVEFQNIAGTLLSTLPTSSLSGIILLHDIIV